MDLSVHTIRTWADAGGIPDLALAELDYRLIHALQALCTDPFLRERLCLKGGTALNKLYLPGMDRLSVDLDFNAVGPAEQVLRERTQYSQAVIAALQQQDAGYSLTYRWRYDQVTVYARFAPLSGAGQQTLKVEISFIERFAILGAEHRPLQSSPFAESFTIPTYRLEELASTKLRALYDRRKGRDIYDLFRIAALDLDQVAVRKMALYYFYRANQVFHYPTFVSNVEQKMRERAFRDDVQGLIRQGHEWNWASACERVLSYFSFMGELDGRDVLFLDLAKYLLHKPYPHVSAEAIRQITHPLAWLMEGLPISLEAATITQDDIKIHLPGEP